MASAAFFLLLALTLIAASVAGRRAWMPVLAASLGFAAWQAGPLVFRSMLVAALGTWILGRQISSEEQSGRQLRLLWAGVALNLVPLIGFKYVEFWAALGLSYFAFQAIAYLCDLYFASAEPEPHLGRFLLSLFFFPKFIQGPVERPQALQSQWQHLGQPTYGQLRLGAALIVWGLIKKLVLAERLGSMVDGVFGSLAAHAPAEKLMATYAFAAQLFCDFSGYTDLALGTALLLGIQLTQNFDGPFAADSMVDFWRRWHISLSTWIRDYVFQPLQMQFRTAGIWGAALALFIAFFAMGVWHGATWGYAVFGLIHGALMAGQQLYAAAWKQLRKRYALPKDPIPTWLSWFVTVHVVTFSFIFFRAAKLADAWAVLKALPAGYVEWAHNSGAAWLKLACLGQASADAAIVWGGVAVLSLAYVARRRWSWTAQAWPLRWAAYTALLAILLLGARFYGVKQFIYAQF